MLMYRSFEDDTLKLWVLVAFGSCRVLQEITGVFQSQFAMILVISLEK